MKRIPLLMSNNVNAASCSARHVTSAFNADLSTRSAEALPRTPKTRTVHLFGRKHKLFLPSERGEHNRCVGNSILICFWRSSASGRICSSLFFAWVSSLPLYSLPESFSRRFLSSFRQLVSVALAKTDNSSPLSTISSSCARFVYFCLISRPFCFSLIVWLLASEARRALVCVSVGVCLECRNGADVRVRPHEVKRSGRPLPSSS